MQPSVSFDHQSKNLPYVTLSAAPEVRSSADLPESGKGGLLSGVCSVLHGLIGCSSSSAVRDNQRISNEWVRVQLPANAPARAVIRDDPVPRVPTPCVVQSVSIAVDEDGVIGVNMTCALPVPVSLPVPVTVPAAVPLAKPVDVIPRMATVVLPGLPSPKPVASSVSASASASPHTDAAEMVASPCAAVPCVAPHECVPVEASIKAELVCSGCQTALTARCRNFCVRCGTPLPDSHPRRTGFRPRAHSMLMSHSTAFAVPAPMAPVRAASDSAVPSVQSTQQPTQPTQQSTQQPPVGSVACTAPLATRRLSMIPRLQLRAPTAVTTTSASNCSASSMCASSSSSLSSTPFASRQFSALASGGSFVIAAPPVRSLRPAALVTAVAGAGAPIVVLSTSPMALDSPTTPSTPSTPPTTPLLDSDDDRTSASASVSSSNSPAVPIRRLSGAGKRPRGSISSNCSAASAASIASTSGFGSGSFTPATGCAHASASASASASAPAPAHSGRRESVDGARLVRLGSGSMGRRNTVTHTTPVVRLPALAEDGSGCTPTPASFTFSASDGLSIEEALDHGLAVLISLNRKQNFFVETAGHRMASTIMENYESCVRSADTQLTAETFTDGIDRVMDAERQRYEGLFQLLRTHYADRAFLVYFRMLERPVEFMAPPKVGLFELSWIPQRVSPMDKMITQHNKKMQQFMNSARLLSGYSLARSVSDLEIAAQPPYTEVYRLLFQVALLSSGKHDGPHYVGAARRSSVI